jgi:thiosulfate dehydrogenase [quinone] large subunit
MEARLGPQRAAGKARMGRKAAGIMAVHHGMHVGGWLHRPSRVAAASKAGAVSAVTALEASIAALRIGTGFLFLWAFFDKTFGWHYSTLPAKAWIHGGSPTKGFLASLNAGPFSSMFHSWAGQGWANWLFMIALLGIGLALVLGVGVRVAAVSGVLLVAFMWLAVWPLAQHATGGALTGSTNPIVDEHVMDALALIVLGVTAAGSRLGLGALWAKLPFVQRHGTLL